MNKLNVLKLASVLIFFISAPLFAEQNIAATGVYLGAGITPVISTGNGTVVDPGISAALGYRFNTYVAIEASYTGFINAFLTGQIIDLNAKAFLPMTSQLSAYGKIGIAYFRSDADFNFWFIQEHITKTMVTPEIGMGLDYNFTPHFAAELGVAALPVQSSLYVIPATLGLRYTFG